MAQQDAPSDSVLLQQFTGIRNTVGAERLGPADLAKAVNVDLDDAGQLRRRRGYTLVSAGVFHSLYRSDGGAIYGVKDGALGLINPDYTFVSLKAGAGDERIAYAQVGDRVYFSSPDISGQIDTTTNTVSDWGAVTDANTWLSPVVAPTETLTEIRGKLLGKPPMAGFLAYYNGRIYLAHGQTVWATELYLYNYVDKTRNFMMFEADITGLAAVTDGVYVGTETGVYFLSGAFGEMRRIRVSADGVIPGSMINASTEDIKKDTTSLSRSAALMLTRSGLCVGYDNGVFAEITDERVWLPEIESAAVLSRRQDGVRQYVAVANSGGTPASNTRIGDYVDAEIRRFQG
jgi:hypothetical protein